jgi:hypothetical protein
MGLLWDCKSGAYPINLLSEHTQTAYLTKRQVATKTSLVLSNSIKDFLSGDVSEQLVNDLRLLQQRKDFSMDVTVAVNFWFLLCLCLIFLVIGLLLGRRNGRDRYY